MIKGPWRTLFDGRRDAGDRRDAVAAALGRLEQEVMEVVWQSGAVSVRDVRAQIPRAVAYTTVMTTLDRLFKKGLLHRERDGRAFVYQAALTRQNMEEAIAARLLHGLLEFDPGRARPLLSNLVETIGDRDSALLDELEELVRQKRRQRDQG
jgi:predicted transcriptional regulator